MLNQTNIDKQLLQDCHILGRFECSTLLLHKNAAIRWFILVPDTSETDLMDLPTALCMGLLAECRNMAKFLKTSLAMQKINYASIGNVVKQLHIHVIGRHSEDNCWPAPIWGHLSQHLDYEAADISSMARKLQINYGLVVIQDFNAVELDHADDRSEL